MVNWGWKEHKWEKYSNWMLLSGSVIAIGYLYTKWDWLTYLLAIWIILTTFIHSIARLFHRLEKRYYNNRLGKRK